jgi:hypothetical protein
MAPRRNTIAEFIAYGNEKLQQPPRSKRVVQVRGGSPRAAAEWASTATVEVRNTIFN